MSQKVATMTGNSIVLENSVYTVEVNAEGTAYDLVNKKTGVVEATEEFIIPVLEMAEIGERAWEHHVAPKSAIAAPSMGAIAAVEDSKKH